MAAGDSPVSICNIGLIALGEPPIVSLLDNRKAAILCNARYDQIRREVLRSDIWNCAKKQAALAANAMTPLFQWEQAYPLPNDFIRVADLPDFDHPRWEIVGNQLMCDYDAPLNLLYVSDLQNCAQMDPIFVAALGLAIAVELCKPITGSEADIGELSSRVEGKMSAARLASAQDKEEGEWDVDVLLRSRI